MFGQKAQKTQQITLKTQQITLFHPKREGLSLTLTYQGQTYNSKCNPLWLINETIGFSWDGKVTVHTTHQNSLIGSIPKIEVFHWSRQCHRYLGPYMISPNKILTTLDPYTYIHVTHLTFLEEP